MPGKLFITATPIGNLGDISQRALETLRSVDLVLTEDTRVTNKLLMHYEIDAPTLSYHHHSSQGRKEEIAGLLEAGKNLALTTDAGTPGISDPGNELIDFLYTFKGLTFKVVPIPGASGLTAILSVCGFNVSKFLFLGFLPKKGKEKIFKKAKETDVPFVFFESPHRIIRTLGKIGDYFGDKRVFIGRELTKLHETHYRGKVSDVLATFKGLTFKGEFSVVVEV